MKFIHFSWPEHFLAAILCAGLGAWSTGAVADIFVTNEGASDVLVFSDSADGNVAPLRQFTLSGQARGIAVDTVHGEIFIATQSGSIHVFNINADVGAVPLRTINGGGDYQGIHVDVANNEVFVANRAFPGIVEVYGRLASGATTPLRTLTIGSEPRGVHVNAAANELYVAGTNYISTYSRTASGPASPLRTIAPSPSVGDLSQLTLDAGELVVANFGSYAIAVWPVGADGQASASRTITGVATQLNSPRGVAVCAGTREYIAANRYGDSITVFAASDNGNVPPSRTISGIATGLSNPRFVAVTGICGSVPVPVVTAVPAVGPLALALLSGLLGVFGAGWARRRAR